MIYTIIEAIELTLETDKEPLSPYWLASQMEEMRLWRASEHDVRAALEKDIKQWGERSQFVKIDEDEWGLRKWRKIMKRKQPTTPDEWLDEIQRAIAHAAEVPFGQLIRDPDKAVNLFHLAPIICLKFRGLDHRDEKLRQKVTEGALANYVVNSDPDGIDHRLEHRSLLAFAVCYVTAHYVLDLIDEEETEAALDYCDEHLG